MYSLRIRHALITLVLSTLAACGGGGGGTPLASGSSGGTVSQPVAAADGTALVALTDAAGDFQHYVVNVVSIKLNRSDGTVVETLPATTQVDFAQLVSLSEIISAAQVPAGTYTSVSLTLDYAGASIVIDDGAGGSLTVPAGNILNGTAGNAPLLAPNSQLTLTLNLPSGQPLVVSSKTVSHVALDFSLAVSNQLSPAAASITKTTVPTVTVKPTLAASVTPDAAKSINLRGGLVSVDTAAGSYSVQVRPFFKTAGTNGATTIKTTSSTVFQIDGKSSTGSTGLAALATQKADTAVLATGSFDVATKTFVAETVYVGSSLPGSGFDGLDGTVVARSGDSLTVASSVVFDRAKEEVSISKTVTVTVGAGTKVTKAGVTGSFTKDDISIGQHLQLSGTLGTDASGNRTLDATAGAARLVVTPLWGLYKSAASNVVTLDLQALDGRTPSAYNFGGAGGTVQTTAYTVGVPATLSLSGLVVGKAVRFFGFAAPYGKAPPAFNAVSLANFAETFSVVSLEFVEPAGATAPFSTLGPDLVISQATLQATDRARIAVGPQFTDIKASAPVAGLTLTAPASSAGAAYVISHRKSRKSDTFSAFADLVAALKTALNGTTAVTDLSADGAYDPATSKLAAQHVFAVLND